MKKGDTLLYKKIEEYIVQLIKSRKLKEGDCLPPEREIGRKFRASQIPVRQATRSLIQKNILERIPYKGTFVKKTSPVQAKTNKIGLLYHFNDESLFHSSFYSSILSGINAQAQKEERTLMFRSFRIGQNCDPNDAFHELDRDVDGFILIDPSYEVLEMIEPAMGGLNKPVVVLNYEGETGKADQVVFDSYLNTKKMVEFLIGLGHAGICFVYRSGSKLFNNTTNPNFLNRQRAYRDTMASHGLAVREDCYDRQAGKEFFERIIYGSNVPTAIVCENDENAPAIYQLAKEYGLAIPEQLTVVGYDGLKETAAMTPPLTTIGTPMAEMGAQGVKIILEKQKDPGRLPVKMVLPGFLELRQSHRSLKEQ